MFAVFVYNLSDSPQTQNASFCSVFDEKDCICLLMPYLTTQPWGKKKQHNKAESPECPSLSPGAMPNAMNLFGQK